MSYEFPPKNMNGNFKNFKHDIVAVTRSKKDDCSTEFCKELRGRIQVYDLDSIKDEWSEMRHSNSKGAKLCSADCYFRASDGIYYFIEFKKSTLQGLNEIDNEEGLPLYVSLRRKAVDSLGLASMTILQDQTGKNIQDHAIFIVVYRSSAEEKLRVLEINKSLTKLASGADSVNRSYPIMWSLDKLRDWGLYRDVHTWPEDVFVSWAKLNLK